MQALSARRVTLKIRYLDQGTTTRSQALSTPVAGAAEIHAVALHLLGRAQSSVRAIRGLGIQLASSLPSASPSGNSGSSRPAADDFSALALKRNSPPAEGGTGRLVLYAGESRWMRPTARTAANTGASRPTR